MKMLGITAVALKRFIRDRSNLFFVFILPLGIIILIGAQFGGDQATRIGVHLPGAGGPVAEALIRALDASEDLSVVTVESADALEEAVGRGTVSIGLEFPENLSERLAAGEDLALTIVAPRDTAVGPFRSLLTEAIAASLQGEAAVRFAVSAGADRDAAEAAAAAIADEIPVISVTATGAGTSLFQGVGSQFEVGATSQLVLFMFLTGLTGSAALIQSRRYGVSRRMLGTPTSAATIVAGEALGRYAVVVVQGLYVVAATTLIFQVDWGSPIGTAGIILVYAAAGAAGAMLLGSIFRRDDQAAIIGVVAALSLGAIGGCMVPLELFSGRLESVARLTPQAWANDAFAELLRRDGTIVDILPQLGVLLGFAAVLLALAAWRMSATLKTS